MPDIPEPHHRRSLRLRGYDYSRAGAYFVTIVTHHGNCFFGDIVNDKTILQDAGECARSCWMDIPRHYPDVKLDEFIVMPNHVHGIIVITGGELNIGGHQVSTDVGIETAVVGAQNFVPLPPFAPPPLPPVAPTPLPNTGPLPLPTVAPTLLPNSTQALHPGPHLSTNQFHRIIPRSIGSIIRGFKLGVTKWCREYTPICTVWQRNYYEHIIRDDRELNRIRDYIVRNPSRWIEDENYME